MRARAARQQQRRPRVQRAAQIAAARPMPDLLQVAGRRAVSLFGQVRGREGRGGVEGEEEESAEDVGARRQAE